MSNFAILNNVNHKDLKVDTKKSAAYGDNQMCVSLTLSELRDAQRDFPIVFHFDKASESYYPMAVLGFEKEENLFLSEAGWDNVFIPAMIEKGPFRIGRQEKSNGEEDLVISVDLDDPRVKESDGEPLFLPHGGNTDYTNHVAGVLNRLTSDRDATMAFCKQLAGLDLLKPLSLEFEVGNGEGIRLSGFYVIDEEKLTKLDPESLSALAKNGFLHGAYFTLSSLSNFGRLIERKKA